jgi:hypothetical protein
LGFGGLVVSLSHLWGHCRDSSRPRDFKAGKNGNQKNLSIAARGAKNSAKDFFGRAFSRCEMAPADFRFLPSGNPGGRRCGQDRYSRAVRSPQCPGEIGTGHPWDIRWPRMGSRAPAENAARGACGAPPRHNAAKHTKQIDFIALIA